MLEPLRNRTYRQLFAAQVIALIGTGLLTVALGLLAYELASDRSVMLSGAGLTIPPLLGAALALWGVQGAAPWTAILIAWPILGAAYAMVVTPAGRLLRRSAKETGPTRAFRRAIRAQPRLLAGHLSDGGVAWRCGWFAADTGHARCR